MIAVPPYRSVDALLTERGRRTAPRVYVESIDPPARLTFADLDRACHRVAGWLGERGIAANDRIALLGDNCLALLVLFFGVQRYGATASPVNVEVNARNLGQILRDVRPRLVLWHRAVAPEVRAAVERSGAEAWAFGDLLDGGAGDDLGAILARRPARSERRVGGPRDMGVLDYTSGTTASPRGVLISHEAFFYMCASTRERFTIGPEERVLEYRSITWASPQLLAVGSTLQSGATLVLGRRFSRHSFFDWIRDHRITIAAGIPTAIGMLLERPLPVTARDVPTLKFITSSAAPLPPETEREFERRYGIPIVQGGGMTEAGFMAGNDPGGRRPGSIGRPMPHLRAWFAGETGAACVPGQEGELMVSGRQMASAYVVEGGGTVAIPQDGFRTGDLGSMDAEGYLYLTGRRKDLIIRGGVNVAPLEVSTALLAHPAVAEAATIGVPDPIYGEAIVSFVALRPGRVVGPARLAEHCAGRLSTFKRPERIIVVNAIPKNDRGKVARDVLLALWRDVRPASSPASGAGGRWS